MPQVNADKINALNLALAVLRGEGGGFSPEEKQRAIDKLQEMLTIAEQEPWNG